MTEQEETIARIAASLIGKLAHALQAIEEADSLEACQMIARQAIDASTPTFH
jgi:hypothetical protein